jgi:maltooligosyltrehalose trehalohydrolase
MRADATDEPVPSPSPGPARSRNQASLPPPLGAFPTAHGTLFRAFSTVAERCSARIVDEQGRALRDIPMPSVRPGLFEVEARDIRPGALYQFVLDGRELPDPYARCLPEGVHGPAQVTRGNMAPRPGPVLRPLSESVIYELHIGTFTPEGTYHAAAGRLGELAKLGITTIELMPLSSFAGQRGWGYDGVAHFAPHAAYGSVAELCDFIDQAHLLGLSVLLDVVYNHFGPAGNYLATYSPLYFTSEIRNAWGDAPNFRFALMRSYVLDNALYWLTEIGFDGLRLDATHAILDPSPHHILRELADTIGELAPGRHLIAEDDRNDPALVGELGMDAVWADDFHHAVRVNLTGERDGYYAAYEPRLEHLAQTIERGWWYEGQVSPTHKHPRGAPAGDLPASAFVYCIQNHDQVGNRALGDRLDVTVGHDAYCAASMLLLFLPMTPLLFMGQEWASSSAFMFFTDHEAELGRAISRGRRDEFAHFEAFHDPELRKGIPDPQAEITFAGSKLRWGERSAPQHSRVLALYEAMLRLRRTHPVMRCSDRSALRACAQGSVLTVERRAGRDRLVLLFNFAGEPAAYPELHCARPVLELRSDAGCDLGAQLPGHTAVLLSGSLRG